MGVCITYQNRLGILTADPFFSCEGRLITRRVGVEIVLKQFRLEGMSGERRRKGILDPFGRELDGTGAVPFLAL